MSMYDQVVACITKPPSQRSVDEVENLYPWFVVKANAFQNLKPEIVKDIIRNCEFTERLRDNVIIRQGDKGDRFYIVLSGKVSIFINTEAVPDDPDEATVIVAEDNFTTSTADNEVKSKKELDRSKYGKHVGVIGEGKSFGELALINKDCVRNASIIVDELTHLVVVDRVLYNRSLRSAQEAEFRQRIEYVNECILFKNWQSRYKRQAAMSLKKELYGFNMPIVKQGDPLNGLIFILKGEAQVVTDVMMHYKQFPQLRLHEDPEKQAKRMIYGEIGDYGYESQTEDRQLLWAKPMRRQGYTAAEQMQAKRHLEIAVVGFSEIIGIIEHGMDLNQYAQSVICMQPTEVYILDAKNFERLISTKRNPKTLHMLKEKAKTKLLNQSSRASHAQIPLFKVLTYRLIEAEKAKEKQKRAQDLESIVTHADPKGCFIPQRGALIDLYGPGTVFYRNKMKRLELIRKQKSKERAVSDVVDLSHRFVSGSKTNGSNSEDEESSYDERESKSRLDNNSQRREDNNESSENEDCETSEDHLCEVEDRLRSWHSKVNDMNDHNKIKDVIAPLERFQRKESKKICPGKKIIMRPRTQGNIIIYDDTNSTHTLDLHNDSPTLNNSPLIEVAHRRLKLKSQQGDIRYSSPQPSHFSMLPDATKTYTNSFSLSGDVGRISSAYYTSNNVTRQNSSSHLQKSISPNSRTKSATRHHYTAEEYKLLKKELIRKQIELITFRVTTPIYDI